VRLLSEQERHFACGARFSGRRPSQDVAVQDDAHYRFFWRTFALASSMAASIWSSEMPYSPAYAVEPASWTSGDG
jgi:hypothetical protein